MNSGEQIRIVVTTAACATFTLNGATVTTNSQTTFEHGTCADIRPGRRVEEKGTRQGTGRVTGLRVEFK